jgi:hypothetical protein
MLPKNEAEFTASILEGFFPFFALIAFLWTNNKYFRKIVLIRWAIVLYIILSFFYAVLYKQANILDFLLIYKSFIYLFFLSLLVDKRLIPFLTTCRLFDILLGIFFIKYTISVVLGLNSRPTVFVENNFELMLLYALYLLRYSVTKEDSLQYLFIVGVITLMSLSRSSLLMYSALALYVVYTSFKKTRVFIIPGAMLFLGAIVYYIFSERNSSLESVDRYKFLMVFWDNVKDWNFLQWLVGAERISPLNEYAQRVMNYFIRLYSYSKDGTAYSVVLHSFLMRVIYDHGVLGLIFILYTTYTLLRINGVARQISFVFIVIVLINGLSVSSFNNLFFALSMVFLMNTNIRFERTELEVLRSKPKVA